MQNDPPALVAVIAMTPDGVIGRDGDIPWHLGSDLRRFKRLTMGGVLLMGRRTFDSIGRPLPGRKTVVITRDPHWSHTGVLRAGSPEDAVEAARELARVEGTDRQLATSATRGMFVVGGAEIYRQLLPSCSHLYLTRVWSQVKGDTKCSIDLSDFQVIEHTHLAASARDDVPSDFLRLMRRNS